MAEAFGLLRSIWMPLLILFALIYGYLNLEIIFSVKFAIILLSTLYMFFVVTKKYPITITFPSKSILKKALVFSLPLLPLTVSEYLISAGDRYILGFFHGSAAIGSYAYFYSILIYILGFFMLPNNMLFPYAAREFKKGNKKKTNFFFNAGAKYSLMLVIPALVGFFILRKEIITMISGSKYLGDLYILPFLIVFPLFEFFSGFYRNICILEGKTKYLAVTYVSAGIVNIALNFILIPKFHLVGAAVATIITYVLLFVLMYLEGKQSVSWDNSFVQIHKIILSAAIMGAVISFFHPTEIVSKIITIAFGAVIYFICIFATRTFVKAELDLIRSILYHKSIRKAVGAASKTCKE